jgi:dUTP pyrophosphatase
MNIQIKLLTANAKIPTRGSDFAAGYDLYTTEPYELKPGERHLYKTGVSTAMPNGIYGRIAPRSGLAYKKGIDVMAGVIDSDYRGEIGVLLVNLGQEAVKFPIINEKGEETPIAQIIFEHHNEVTFHQTDNLPQSVRNTGGFGSTSEAKKKVVFSKEHPVESPKGASDLINKYREAMIEAKDPEKYESAIREREKELTK